MTYQRSHLVVGRPGQCNHRTIDYLGVCERGLHFHRMLCVSYHSQCFHNRDGPMVTQLVYAEVIDSESIRLAELLGIFLVWLRK